MKVSFLKAPFGPLEKCAQLSFPETFVVHCLRGLDLTAPPLSDVHLTTKVREPPNSFNAADYVLGRIKFVWLFLGLPPLPLQKKAVKNLLIKKGTPSVNLIGIINLQRLPFLTNNDRYLLVREILYMNCLMEDMALITTTRGPQVILTWSSKFYT